MKSSIVAMASMPMSTMENIEVLISRGVYVGLLRMTVKVPDR